MTETQTGSKSALHFLTAILQLAVTAGALYLVIWHFGIARFVEILKQTDILWLSAAVIGAAVQLTQMSWRWQLTTQIVFEKLIALRKLVVALGRSQLYGLPLPSVLGADAIRIASLVREVGVGNAARSVICDRLVGLFAHTLLVAVTLPLFYLRIDSGLAFYALALASLGGLCGFLVAITLPDFVRRFPLIGRYASQLGVDLRQAVTKPTRAGYILLHGGVTYLIGGAVFFALVLAVGQPVSYLDALLIVLPATLIASIPISIAGWGVREVAIATSFAAIAADPAKGVAASILFGLVYPVAGGLMELAAALWPKTEKR
jgi:uncharacterized membrane protein YbhN (UPF0104 family)